MESRSTISRNIALVCIYSISHQCHSSTMMDLNLRTGPRNNTHVQSYFSCKFICSKNKILNQIFFYNSTVFFSFFSKDFQRSTTSDKRVHFVCEFVFMSVGIYRTSWGNGKTPAGQFGYIHLCCYGKLTRSREYT